MILPSKIRFVDEKLKQAFYHLENGDDADRFLFKKINKVMNKLEQNTFCGIQIPKGLIPYDYYSK